MIHAPQPDSKIVIMGAGIIGNLWMCLLHHYGFRGVIVSEPSPIRRQLAEQLGNKDGLTRSSDLVSCQKNRIFDLDRLREVESKKFFLPKVEETIKIRKFLKQSFSIC